MSISQWVEWHFYCDICNKNRIKDPEMYYCRYKKNAIKYAKNHGWIIKQNKTICPECANKL